MALRITISQINVTVGNFSNNLALIKKGIDQAEKEQADLILFPELCITGYPPEDLLFRPDFLQQVEDTLEKIKRYSISNLVIVVGAPVIRRKNVLFNMAIVYQKGRLILEYAKQSLPNYRVFDEQRYFTKGNQYGLSWARGYYF